LPENERSITVSGKHPRRNRFFILPLLLLTATAAGAGQTVNYVVSGPIGAAVWGLGDEPGTEAVAFAFSHLTPVEPKNAAASSPTATAEKQKLPPPGPRVVFSVTQWALVDGEWAPRHWYGDAPLPEKALAVAADLSAGQLDATIPGILEERDETGAVVRREVPGRLQVQWSAIGKPANTTLAYTYQTPSYATTLQTVGSGRASQATATVTVEALGGPIQIWGLGSLSAVTSGLLSVTQEQP
jgi:hypothetical protein